MRRFPNVLLAVALSASAANAASAPRTVGDFGNVMNATAGRLDVQLQERQKAGDAAAAQRLALVAAMVRRASAELRAAEQSALTDDADILPANVKARLDAAFATTHDSENRAADSPGFVDEAHKTFNALIDALPIKRPHPLFYGLLSRDIASADDQLGADVVVYGDRLFDPIYHTRPSVAVEGRQLPEAAVWAHEDRLDITLPPEIKSAVHFAPPPCEPRTSFGLRVHDVYAEAHGVWPLQWHSQVETNADLYALASPAMFEARVAADVETSASAASTVDFRHRSDYAVADCDHTRTALVEMTLPEGATDVDCKADWVQLSGEAAANGACAQDGDVVRATGKLVGGAKVCSPDKVCSCPVSAQGFLEMSGSYRIAQSATGTAPIEGIAPLAFPAGGRVRANIAAAGEHLRHLKIDVSRRACPAGADVLDFTIADGESASAVSRTGGFRAVYQKGVLSVGSAEAFEGGVGTP